jgi:CBS domain-containing protein
MRNRTVRDLIENDKQGRWAELALSPEDSVATALAVMNHRDLSAVLIAENGRAVGIFTDRDFARHSRLKHPLHPATPLRDLMTTRLTAVGRDTSLETAMVTMLQAGVRHLPVIEEGQVICLLGIEDIAKEIIDEREFWIERMSEFITGSREASPLREPLALKLRLTS